MRNRPLHAALAAFAEEAAHQLAADTADGAEVPFEVVELGGTRREAPLYCYRPLTASFIDERLSTWAASPPTCPPCTRSPPAAAWTPTRRPRRGSVPAQPRARAEEALRHFLTRIFHESTDFHLSPERVAYAYEELETR